MRKRLNMLFAIGLVSFTVLTACGAAEENSEDTGLTVTEDAASTTEDTTDDTSAEAAQNTETTTDSGPEYSITIDEGVPGEDEYFSKSIERIEIDDDNYAALKESVDAYYDNLVAKGYEEFKSTFSDEAAEAQSDGSDSISYTYNVYSTVQRCDDQILSILVTVNQYTGGAHGSNAILGANFDVNTGKQISISDLGNISSEAKSYILNQLSNSPDYTASLFPEYEQTISDDFDDKYDDFSFLLDVRGVEYIFQEYDIAPYAAGQVDFTVPYTELSSFKTDYLPKAAFYSFDMTENLHETIDINSDGTSEDIYYSTAYESEDGAELTLYVDGQSVTHDELNAYAYCQLYFAHTSNGNYVFEVIYDDNSTPTTYLYEVSDGITLKGQVEGMGVVHIHDGTVEMATYNPETYTWNASVTYAYDDDENGFAEVKAVTE